MFKSTSNVVDYASVAPRPATPRWMLWTGRVISAIPVLFMGGGGIAMLFNPKMMQEGLAAQGWPANIAYTVLALEIGSALIYAIPQTAVLGAILLTGYLGGAVATHLRIGENGPAVVPVIFGVLVWLGLLLRDARVRSLLPLRRVDRSA